MPTIDAPTIDNVTVTVTVNKTYPNYNVILLNDDGIDGLYVVECLCKVLPQMTQEKAFNITMSVHRSGAGIVWTGPQEVAELYHDQLISMGMVMAPLEKCGG
jgi:ATP-dependent Clp protease adaptor protein ClpS